MMDPAKSVFRGRTLYAILVSSLILPYLPGCYSGKAEQQASSFLRRRTRRNGHHHYWDTGKWEKDVQTTYEKDVQTMDAETAAPGPAEDEGQNINPYWDPSFWNPLANTYWNTEYWHAKLSDNLLRVAEDDFVDQCLAALEDRAVNNKVNRQQYVQFLRDISKGTLVAQEFKDLPLFLSMIFFTAGCTSGEDCVGEEPKITTAASPQEESQLNGVLCRQLMRFPFLEVVFPFQFLILVSDDVTAAELLAANDTNKILPNLERALDIVLVEGLNCSYAPDEATLRSREGERRQVTPTTQRQPQPQEDCDFSVSVSIEDAADYPCGFENSCILVFSDVTIYAVVKESRDEPELRILTTNLLRDAINGDKLESYLPPSVSGGI